MSSDFTHSAPVVTPSSPGSRTTSPIVRAIAALAILALSGFIVVEGRVLYREFHLLRMDEYRSKMGTVIGYENISPRPEYARAPADWFHSSNGVTRLWAGWKEQKHQWFQVAQGDLERHQITEPMGRDAIQAIDYPIIENAGGPRWDKIPGEHLVAGIELDGVKTVYPMRVLEKCAVVNDLIGELPLLVTFTPFVDFSNAVVAYEPKLDGRRITMGLSGYFFGRKPLLYDRGTQSLWVEINGAMKAIAGIHKGAELRRVATIPATTWSEWRALHPESQLIVGADRTRKLPEL